MLDLLEKINFLKDLPPTEIILHVRLFNSLNGDLFTGKLMDAKSNLPKSSLSYQFDILIVVESGWRQLIVLNDVYIPIKNYGYLHCLMNLMSFSLSWTTESFNVVVGIPPSSSLVLLSIRC